MISLSSVMGVPSNFWFSGNDWAEWDADRLAGSFLCPDALQCDKLTVSPTGE